MRNIPQPVIDAIPNGSEPVFVIGIEWEDNKVTYYASKKLEPYLPYIVSVSAIGSSATGSGGQATQFEATFDDTSGHFKALFDSRDIHFRPITVFHYFDGIGSGLYPIFEGQVASPISWDEETRIFQITAITRKTNIEVGFSVEEGQFADIHESLIGQPFPLGFGTPINVPALPLQVIPTGMTTEAFGIVDPTLTLEIQRLGIEWGNKQNYGMYAAQQAAVAYLGGDDNIGDQWNSISVEAQTQAGDIQAELTKLQLLLVQQKSYAKSTNYVIGGYRFPQKKKVKVKINEFLFWAVFHGDDRTTAPDNFDEKCRVTLTPIIPPIQKVVDNKTGQLVYEKQNFTFIQAGAQVTIAEEYPIDWVVNCIPSTIKAVYAYRAFNGSRHLTQVPSQYYDVVSYNWTGWLQPTVIRMKQPMSTVSYFENLRTTRLEDYNTLLANTNGTKILPHIINNVDWSDEIYVTYESSVGPNLVDVMIWLIQTYTNYDYDAISFDSVKIALGDYPANMVIFERPKVDDLLEDLAYQGRSRIWLKDGKYYLKFLPRKEDPVDTLTLDDFGSLAIRTTTTEDVVTKYIATWRTDYVKPENRIILRYNAGLKRYGINEGGYNFTAFNARELVERASTFWLIRQSNTWKYVDATVYMDKLNLELNDTVTIDTPHISCDGVIENIEYNPDDYSIRLTIWTPIRAGESQPYDFAWPAGISETTFFPTFNEITSGAAGGFNSGVQGALPPFTEIQVNFPSNKSNSQPAADNRPRDYGSYFLSDEVAPEFSPSSLPISQPINPVTDPLFNYNYISIPNDRVPTDDVNNACWPAMVISGGPETYSCRVYKKGLSEDYDTVDVKYLDEEVTDIAPPDTWTLVAMTKKDDGTKEYTFQTPIWLVKP